MTKLSLDAKTVESFWRERSQRAADLSFEEVCNLEGDPERLKLKIRLESEVIFSRLDFTSDKRVLDLGAGCGQWALCFAPRVKEVVAVEREEIFCRVGKNEAARRGLHNVHFVTRPAEEYVDESPFDIIFVSGVLMYLPDHQTKQVARHLETMKGPGSVLFLREPVSLLGEEYAINKYSPKLGTDYSALYRSGLEIKNFFLKQGWSLSAEGWFYEDGCILNVHAETRLRYFSFTAS